MALIPVNQVPDKPVPDLMADWCIDLALIISGVFWPLWLVVARGNMSLHVRLRDPLFIPLHDRTTSSLSLSLSLQDRQAAMKTFNVWFDEVPTLII